MWIHSVASQLLSPKNKKKTQETDRATVDDISDRTDTGVCRITNGSHYVDPWVDPLPLTAYVFILWICTNSLKGRIYRQTKFLDPYHIDFNNKQFNIACLANSVKRAGSRCIEDRSWRITVVTSIYLRLYTLAYLNAYVWLVTDMGHGSQAVGHGSLGQKSLSLTHCLLCFQGHAILWCWIAQKWHSYCGIWIGNSTQAFKTYRFQWRLTNMSRSG